MTARPPAPPLTPAERDVVDRFEAAQYPAEVAVEWVRALMDRLAALESAS